MVYLHIFVAKEELQQVKQSVQSAIDCRLKQVKHICRNQFKAASLLTIKDEQQRIATGYAPQISTRERVKEICQQSIEKHVSISTSTSTIIPDKKQPDHDASFESVSKRLTETELLFDLSRLSALSALAIPLDMCDERHYPFLHFVSASDESSPGISKLEWWDRPCWAWSRNEIMLSEACIFATAILTSELSMTATFMTVSTNAIVARLPTFVSKGRRTSLIGIDHQQDHEFVKSQLKSLQHSSTIEGEGSLSFTTDTSWLERIYCAAPRRRIIPADLVNQPSGEVEEFETVDSEEESYYSEEECYEAEEECVLTGSISTAQPDEEVNEAIENDPTKEEVCHHPVEKDEIIPLTNHQPRVVVNPYKLKKKPTKRSFFPQLDSNIAVDSKITDDEVGMERAETNSLQPTKRCTDESFKSEERTTLNSQPSRAARVDDLSNDTTVSCDVEHASSSGVNSEGRSESTDTAAQGPTDNASSTDTEKTVRTGAHVEEEVTLSYPSESILEKNPEAINSSSDEPMNDDAVGSGVFHHQDDVDMARNSPGVSEFNNYSDETSRRNFTADERDRIGPDTSVDSRSQKIHTSLAHTDSLSNPTVITDTDPPELASRELDSQNVCLALMNENDEAEEIIGRVSTSIQYDEQLTETARHDIVTVHEDTKHDGEEALVVSPSQTNRKESWRGDSWMDLGAECEVPKAPRSPQIDSQGIDLSILSQLPLALRSEARLAHFLGTESSDPAKKRKGTLHKWMVDSSSIQKVPRVSLSPQRTKVAKRNRPATGIATFFPSKSGN
jgi:hypothetical protein